MKLTISNAYGYNGTIDGYMVGAIDGTKFFGSNKKFCPGCLKNNNHNFHSGVVMATIGKGPKLTVGFEMYKPGIDSTSKKDGKPSQIMIVTTCMEMNLKTLFKMIRARWDIENCIFNNLKEHCGLDHCYVHGGNAVEAIIYLIFIAANILQLFLCRRLRRNYETQKEIVRLIANGFIKMEYLPELVFKGS